MKAIPLFLLTVLLSTAMLTQCDTLGPDPKTKDIQLDQNFANATGDFSFDFIKTLEKEEQDKNFFVSPLSLHMALGMLLNGSDNSSEDQLLKTLKLEGFDRSTINDSYTNLISNLPNVDPRVKNLLANSVWQRQDFPVEQSFKDVMSNAFKADFYEEPFDGSTLNKINNWASDNTNGKIRKVLDQISGDAVMFLMNALYFKGDWTQEFDPKSTQKASFDGTGQVDMMSKLDTFAYAKMDGYKALNMPYGGGNYQMRVLLPDDGNVNALINKLNLTEWKAISSQQAVQKVQVGFPKFKMEYEKELNDVLVNMGMPVLFSPDADLSKISPPAGKIQVSFVKQNAFVEVDEKGTEAAAVTTIGIELTSAPIYESFYCDKPFLFFIYEKSSGTIQFVGKVLNPAS